MALEKPIRVLGHSSEAMVGTVLASQVVGYFSSWLRLNYVLSLFGYLGWALMGARVKFMVEDGLFFANVQLMQPVGPA